MQLLYYGYVTIEYWEYAIMFFYLVVLYVLVARRKNLLERNNPEYRWMLPGLFAKVIGAIFFAHIYFFYYRGGDTTAYFYSSVALSKLAFHDTSAFFTVLFGENSLERLSLFTETTGRPFTYVFLDDRQYMVVRLVTPFTMIGLNSFMLTTVVFSSVSYLGIWKFYRTLYRYFPRVHKQLAIAVLFMPSSVVWGSAILKDTITFSCFCYILHAVDNFWFRRIDRLSSVVTIVVCSIIIVLIKPYIFMVLVPTVAMWLSFARITQIRNAAIRYLVLPIASVILTVSILALLTAMGDRFGQFSLQSALDNIVNTQQDLAYNVEYGSNSFDVGPMEPNWPSVLSKFPIATTAAMFRPFITECNNMIMLLAGAENLFILLLFVLMLWKSRITFFISALSGNPIVLVFFFFTLLYGFITGVTTPNFGALVRFKIPLLPAFVGGMYIVIFLSNERIRLRNQGLTFRFKAYRNGDPYVERTPDGWPIPPKRRH